MIGVVFLVKLAAEFNCGIFITCGVLINTNATRANTEMTIITLIFESNKIYLLFVKLFPFLVTFG